MTLAETFANRRVFVTGHTGFKGAWLAEWLVAMSAQVTGYALDPPTRPNLFDALGLGGRLRHVVADVRDRDRLVAAVQAAQPSVVFHLAAQALVRRAYADPRDTFETNVMGTVNVLEAARACPSVRAVVVVTSDKCYQNLETGRAFRETDAMGGRDPTAPARAARSWSRRPTVRVSLPTAPRWPPCAREMSSAPATGPPTGSSPTASEPSSPATRSSFGTPMPSARGSTSSSRCRGTSGSPPACWAIPTGTKEPGTSGPAILPATSPCAGWSSAS